MLWLCAFRGGYGLGSPPTGSFPKIMAYDYRDLLLPVKMQSL